MNVFTPISNAAERENRLSYLSRSWNELTASDQEALLTRFQQGNSGIYLEFTHDEALHLNRLGALNGINFKGREQELIKVTAIKDNEAFIDLVAEFDQTVKLPFENGSLTV